ncbi:Glycoside hydrolase, clan GH-D [Beauveria brongniartii RCEF 3172]|uniref:Glycoside hydrolase, clan GH-D n=1 Tax=Beauveria brongniartii RCEF 3172 TaxID=1081107 RepID=A0A166W369_9HYPO|nr:Glycoside hydrolase, clan GH-D [Beauveria brongniartii RCEF 3172]
MAAIQQSSPIIWWWFSKTTTILWGSSSVQPLSQSSVIFRNSTAGAGLMKHATTLRATYERATPQQHSGKSKPTPLFTMQLVGALDYSLALVVCGFGVVYLSLGLAIYCSPQRGDRLAALNDGTSFLKRKFFIYSVSSFAFMASFFIARQKPDNQLLIFVLFNAWRLSNSLCISAELCHIHLQINPFKGVCSSLSIVGLYLLLAVAVLVPGFQNYVTAGRQWLWLFMPAHAAVCLVMPFSRNRPGEYPKPVYFLLALCVICAGTGLAATIVSTQDAPELQQIQYGCQSTIPLATLYVGRIKALVEMHNNSKEERERARLPQQPVSATNSHIQLHHDNLTCFEHCDRSGGEYELHLFPLGD